MFARQDIAILQQIERKLNPNDGFIVFCHSASPKKNEKKAAGICGLGKRALTALA
jgi:hypothetical protein